MIKKILACLVLFFIIVGYVNCYASWAKKPSVEISESYRYDTRQDNHQLLITRLSGTLAYLNQKEVELFTVTPFLEMRRNIDRDLWERKELGVEFGRDIFPWLYLGEGIQQVWVKEDVEVYNTVEKREFMESETRLVLSKELLSNRYLTLNGFVADEYTYDLYRGQGIRNEVAIGVKVPLGKYLETSLNWRHIDRIHYYDSDIVECGLAGKF